MFHVLLIELQLCPRWPSPTNDAWADAEGLWEGNVIDLHRICPGRVGWNNVLVEWTSAKICWKKMSLTKYDMYIYIYLKTLYNIYPYTLYNIKYIYILSFYILCTYNTLKIGFASYWISVSCALLFSQTNKLWADPMVTSSGYHGYYTYVESLRKFIPGGWKVWKVEAIGSLLISQWKIGGPKKTSKSEGLFGIDDTA